MAKICALCPGRRYALPHIKGTPFYRHDFLERPNPITEEHMANAAACSVSGNAERAAFIEGAKWMQYVLTTDVNP